MFLQDLRYLPVCSGYTQNHYLQQWKQIKSGRVHFRKLGVQGLSHNRFAFDRSKAIFYLLLTVPRRYFSCFRLFQGDISVVFNRSKVILQLFLPFQGDIYVAFDHFKMIFQLLLTVPRRYFSCFKPFQGDISVAFDRFKVIFQFL